MRLLGLDPGIGITGWAIIDHDRGQMRYIDGGVIRTSARIPTPQRLLTIQKELKKLIKRFRPQRCALEQLFFATNQKTAMVVSEARGVLQATLAAHTIPLVELTPLQVKLALTGSGNAHKHQVGKMVMMILKLPRLPKPDDHADAVAIALAGAPLSRNEK